MPFSTQNLQLVKLLFCVFIRLERRANKRVYLHYWNFCMLRGETFILLLKKSSNYFTAVIGLKTLDQRCTCLRELFDLVMTVEKNLHAHQITTRLIAYPSYCIQWYQQINRLNEKPKKGSLSRRVVYFDKEFGTLFCNFKVICYYFFVVIGLNFLGHSSTCLGEL